MSPQTWSDKIRRGILPNTETQSSKPEESFAQLRITPPAYSGLKPQFLNKSISHIEILAGSKIEVDVHTSAKPKLKMGGLSFSFKQKDRNIWTIKKTIPETNSIHISTYGITRFSQNVTWLKDIAPTVSWKAASPDILPAGDLRISLKITDDYGINKVMLRAILAPGEKKTRFGSDLKLERSVSLPIRNGITDISSVFDTTGHPFAGRKVTLMAEVQDFAGNTAQTQPIEFTLPIRQFQNPAAQKLAMLREELLIGVTPIEDILSGIQDILFNPQTYQWDTTATLGLRSAAGRLYYSPSPADQESVAAILWSVAMRIENGPTAETAQSLQSALEKLQQALQQGDKAQAAQLMQEFLQALVQHIQSIAKKIENSGQNTLSQALNMKSLNDFIKKLQSDIQNGNMDAALKKINDLQQLADFMNTSMSQKIPEKIQEMMKNLEEIQALIERQKKLLDQTREEKSNDLSPKSQEQRAINKAVPDLKPLETVKEEMSQSATSLDNKDKQGSIIHQEKALQALGNASKSVQQQLQEALQNMMAFAPHNGRQDPLGKPSNLNEENVEIPDGHLPKRADQIIKTLREREGDMQRPLEERNYYQRLLKEW